MIARVNIGQRQAVVRSIVVRPLVVRHLVVLTLLGLLTTPVTMAEPPAPPDLAKETVVQADLASVWDAWTTVEGLKFISAQSRVELEHGGAYEWFLDLPADENGRRGGEGAKLLVVLPRELLAFTWTFPPDVPTLRNAQATTQVVVRFDALSPEQTRVRLDATGWKAGEDWQAGWQYFDRAWSLVLQRLTDHFAARAGDT